MCLSRISKVASYARNESRETAGERKMKEKATSMIEGGVRVFLPWEKRFVEREKR